MTLKGKSALVTGAAQGIGRDIALALAADGADVAICDVNLDAAQKTAADIEALGRTSAAYKANVAASAEVTAMIDQVVEKFGRIDVLVNNAGITRDGLILRMKEEDWDLVLSINLKGAFNCVKAALKYMTKQRGGTIINVASIVGVMGNAGQANYVASKAGLIGLTKTIAREYANRSITANAVAPGFIDTAMTQALSENVRQDLAKQIPLGKLGTPEDVANAVRFLASPWAAYITGQVVHVNGGMYM
ncbi:MAG: 3-oxoacyl-[acyl-carrier-protein] reductase [Nitrospirae bacterium GWC2_57_13]|nr:MAG: 3-oxoacyl-[acyl-carrier-protein] reductase [Nitrospirae bacterium GWC1_57_7]OGW28408.1 MAG: 3-oxoacyl-[acyl-carrier-protein] reductase [Nitrospirae bacterium GWC2_57_13]OGW46603.1 MAG: 3-oxoacyl-[acyl-carrier-protein] reductase [Nitrospirae bacterium GWD2_57_8]HAR45894.1 3-oxoacyl-ACP reductase [Nitrospiraceae bacterium]HAS53202.1 3-oxoacyl-ACP reductase [Nitrospiraceae bacterium]